MQNKNGLESECEALAWKEKGVLKEFKGIWIPYEVLTEVLDGKQIPVLDGFDCSHTHPMLTLPLGVKLAIDFDNKNISITEQYLSTEK